MTVATRTIRTHAIDRDRLNEFGALGLTSSWCFPHRFYCLPKAGPDGLQLAERTYGAASPADLWEIVLFADPSALDGLPASLFFDDDVIWHQQQFGMTGHVASATLALKGRTLYVLTLLSDLVQRISKRRDLKTRVEKRFRGWVPMIQNAVVCFAAARGCREILWLTAEAARRHTDPTRPPQPELFDRIYDRSLSKRFPVVREGDWWRLLVAEAIRRAVLPRPIDTPTSTARVICICHDIERQWGHPSVPERQARRMEATARSALAGMLEAEREREVKATYHVLGRIFRDVHEPVRAGGHACAFHSFDHAVERLGVFGWRRWEAAARRTLRPEVPFDSQLARCRTLDYRLKGYRPPQSRIGPGLSDRHLSFYNFEWLASSAHSIGSQSPRLERGIVKIPIHFDDFPLHRGVATFDEWEAQALREVDARAFVAFSLHDCYADRWMPRYRAFLDKIRLRGECRTLDQVAAAVALAHAR